ncbi:L-serine ammonia-lyase [Myxococcus sp. CA051A]|uniref:L-serine dehydratase n=1 Tax=Myxococcus llanfairpwllgwyngyllgogerychwyrndrobwllllantysiliogogogochensis TaxID=2590453 RepID=A0A540X6K1_9BACT|nr:MULTISPECIES: L-serine ammonia-lyase [Myxococcus]NTX00183.1 L-serine ammonia-lyase [Myxococcus sp. CA040A]NTX38309.1 L-serine ammonia-lyase [Myxococcus sp. CA033]NTX49679.1 L-serine ammonia-lyase [Myxococcus sp. CA039A]NTX65453.1 L-serine ammonia-lyase [Myxococcus sp. CA051A]TQF16911.1 L-serine ammonia-lyase [Myxococcus llanfairpwllgwyngyllgogerychwyrndrobwllllantysiliogogogochensis]
MAVSVFDLFKIGIGPSSSHTVGPMRAARTFVLRLAEHGHLEKLTRLKVELFGSLGATGKGHGSDKAVVLGLRGDTPEAVDVEAIPAIVTRWRTEGRISVLGQRDIVFKDGEHLVMHRRRSLPFHPNGMRFSASGADGVELDACVYYSVGGGFVVDESAATGQDPLRKDTTPLPFPFQSAATLLELCERERMPISALMMANEKTLRSEQDIRSGLLRIWDVMQACVRRGCASSGILPGGLKVERRAAAMYQRLLSRPEAGLTNPLTVLDWVNLYALAVNEENAAGGRVVTAPTNGAAGIIPAVLHYYWRFWPGANEDGVVRFLLTAGAIGVLYKENASISGAEVGCQGEVGSACSMAAGALTEVLGGTPLQVENAAEIAMEHNLGLTCDPIGGLVQVPCIERNAMASVKAINASRMALSGDGRHFVSLDKVIRTMRDTGRDMKDKYKETARGGLAVNVLEVANLSVGLPEC